MSVHAEEDDDGDGCPHCERIDNAVDAIVSIVNMFKPEPSDGFNALAIAFGFILVQFVKEDNVSEVVESICEQALYVFSKENGLEDKPSKPLQAEDSIDDNSSESPKEKPKTHH